MIAGYAVAGQLLDEPKYTAAAAKAADFVLTKLRTKDGRLLRTYGAAPAPAAEARLNAYLDDYAFLVHGLLCLHDATEGQEMARRGAGADRHDGEVSRRREGRRLLLHRRTTTRSCSRAARTSTTAPSRRATAWRRATWSGCGRRPARPATEPWPAKASRPSRRHFRRIPAAWRRWPRPWAGIWIRRKINDLPGLVRRQR